MMSYREKSLPANGVSVATLVLLVASASLNVVQGRRLWSPPSEVHQGPAPGTVAPPLVVQNLNGQPVAIDFSGRPTILYYFSPQCSWCERNWLNIKALMANTEGSYRFVGLSTTPDVSGYVLEHRLHFEIYSGMSLETARKYGFGGTPQTVVVSGEGRILYGWSGAYGGQQKSAVEKAFGIVLPGLAMSGER